MQGLKEHALMAAAVFMLGSPVLAWGDRPDRMEDRIDRAENALDENVDCGWREVA